MTELYYYQIHGIVYGEPREMTTEEATARNEKLVQGMVHGRWRRAHEFILIDEVKVCEVERGRAR